MALNLSLYDIIKGPVLTDKAYRQYKALKTMVLSVHPQANKPQVKEAIERLFNVKVDDVRVSVRKGKMKFIRAQRKTTQMPLRKYAYVTLKPGYSFDVLGQGMVSADAPHATSEAKE